MDVFSILFLCLISIIIGIILTLVAQYYILAKIVQRKPLITTVNKPIFEKYCLPEVKSIFLIVVYYYFVIYVNLKSIVYKRVI